MYFLVNGQVVVLDAAGEERERLGPGSFFGEIAVLENVERTASTVAKTFCTVLILSRRALEAVKQAHPAPVHGIRRAAEDRIDEVVGAQLMDKAQLIASVPLFADAAGTLGFVQMMARALVPRVFPADAVVCRRGDVEGCMYFVVSGQVAVIGDDLEEKVVIGPGAFFGEASLLMDVGRTGTVRTTSATTLWVLSRADFAQCGRAYPSCLDAVGAASADLVAAAKGAEEGQSALRRLDGLAEMSSSQSAIQADQVAQRRFTASRSPSLLPIVDNLPDCQHLTEMLKCSLRIRSESGQSDVSLRKPARDRHQFSQFSVLSVVSTDCAAQHRHSLASTGRHPGGAYGAWYAGPGHSPVQSPAHRLARRSTHGSGSSHSSVGGLMPSPRRRHTQNPPFCPSSGPPEPGQALPRPSPMPHIGGATDPSTPRGGPQGSPTAACPGLGVDPPSPLLPAPSGRAPPQLFDTGPATGPPPPSWPELGSAGPAVAGSAGAVPAPVPPVTDAPPPPPPPFFDATAAPPAGPAAFAAGLPPHGAPPPPGAPDTAVGVSTDSRRSDPSLRPPTQPLRIADHPPPPPPPGATPPSVPVFATASGAPSSTSTASSLPPPEALIDPEAPGLGPGDQIVAAQARPLSPTLGSPLAMLASLGIEEGAKSSGPAGDDPLDPAEEDFHPFSPFGYDRDNTIALNRNKSKAVTMTTASPRALSDALDHADLAYTAEAVSGVAFLQPRMGKARQGKF